MPKVASSLLKNEEGKILLLKRSQKVSTYRGMWGIVAGYVENGEKPYETAIKEIREEVGIYEDDLELIKQLDPVGFTDFYDGKKFDWKIYPFFFIIKKKGKINIDWEHLEYCWIHPTDIEKYNTVPRLKEIVKRLLS